MKPTILALLLLFAFGAQSQNKKTFELSEFNTLKVTGYIDVNIIHSDEEFKVVASNDIKMDFNNLDVDLDGLDLKLSIKKGDFKEHPVQVDVYLNLESLSDVKAFGNANITLKSKESLEISKIELNAQAGGHLFFYLDCGSVEATVSQGGRIALEGFANNLEANVNTGGTIAAMNLEAQNVVAKIKAGGEIFVLPVKKLDAKVTAGGRITYRGNPEELKTKTLGGTIEKMGAKKEE